MKKQNQKSVRLKSDCGKINLISIFSVCLLSIIAHPSFAQHWITGKVVSGDSSLRGVSVQLKGTAIGTTTDATGHYRIAGTIKGRLVYSFVGFANQEIDVNNRSQINISLVSNEVQANDVVVVGYGHQNRTNVTGSISSANLEAFRDAPNTTIAQSLQGTVPGLNVGAVSGAGNTPTITIRGRNTISGNQNVLIVLDGIQYSSPLSSINPDDIISIDVLKDASATAVYGAQAANGVILVTSRKGSNSGKARVNLSSSYSTQTPYGNNRPMNRDQYLEHIRNQYWSSAYLGPDFTQPNPAFNLVSKVDISMKDASGNLLSTNFDWFGAATKPGFVNDNQMSISGGNEKMNYLISGGFTNQAGFIINDLFKRKSLRVNLEAQPFSWMKVGVQSFGSFLNYDGAEPNMGSIMLQSPLLKPYDSLGNVIPYPFNTLDVNPFTTYYVGDYERYNNFFANVYTDIALPIKGLSYRLNFGQNYRLDLHNYSSQYGAGLTGQAYKAINQYYNYTFDNILTYNHAFGLHSITATALYGAIQRQNDYTAAVANGFSRLTLGYNNLFLGTLQYTGSNAFSEALAYQMARVNYAFDNKYLLTATVRRDGFSGFAANNKYGIFPSVSAGWVLTNEKFFKNSWANFVKLRAGYGVSGNQTARYSSLDAVNTQAAYVFGDGGTTVFGQNIATLANPNLKWEKTFELNVGTDFTLLKGRLSGSFDYYNRDTKDLLFSVNIPSVTGFTSINTNVGEVGNKGFEISLTSKNVDQKNFKWNTTFGFSRNVNKIIALLGSGDLVSSNLFIGQPISAINDYTTNGIYQVGEATPAGYYTGTYRVVDKNNDGVITTADRSILGYGDPAYRFSFLNTIQCKGFTLTFFINSIQGGTNGYRASNSPSLVLNDNTVRWNYNANINYWSPINLNGEYPMFTVSPTINPNVYRDRSFIRLQDVTLSYKLTSFLKNAGVQNASVYVSGKNLKTWTKWEGFDPEFNGGGLTSNRPILTGVDLGINLTF